MLSSSLAQTILASIAAQQTHVSGGANATNTSAQAAQAASVPSSATTINILEALTAGLSGQSEYAGAFAREIPNFQAALAGSEKPAPLPARPKAIKADPREVVAAPQPPEVREHHNAKPAAKREVAATAQDNAPQERHRTTADNATDAAPRHTTPNEPVAADAAVHHEHDTITVAEAREVVEKTGEVIDAIDLAIASGAGVLSPEMMAMLQAMKGVLQQLAQSFATLAPATASGTQSVTLDSKTLAPLLGKLTDILNSLKQANMDFAAQLGVPTEDISRMVSASSDAVKHEAKLPPSLLAQLQAITAQATGIQQKMAEVPALKHAQLVQSPIQGVTPLQASADAVMAQHLTSAEQHTTLTDSAISRKHTTEPTATLVAPAAPSPTANLAASTANLTAAAVANVTDKGGQFSGQFSQSGQGQGQGGSAPVANINGAHSGNAQAVLAKDAPGFEQMLRQPVRGSASEQVAFQMKSMVKDGISKMIVRLDPPELGALEIKMEVNREGRTGIIVQVDRQQTLELLQRDSRFLQQALNDAGLKTDSGSLSFNLRGENNSSGGEQRQAHSAYPIQEDTLDEDLLRVTAQTYTTDVQHGVNIHI